MFFMISVFDSDVVYGMNWEMEKTDEIKRTAEYNPAIDLIKMTPGLAESKDATLVTKYLLRGAAMKRRQGGEGS